MKDESLPESASCMTGELRHGKNHDILISRGRNCCKMRPKIGMIINSSHIRPFAHSLLQIPIWIVGGGHELDHVRVCIRGVAHQRGFPFERVVLVLEEICLSLVKLQDGNKVY